MPPSDSLRHEVRTFIVDRFLFGDDTGFPNSASLLEEAIIDSMGVLEVVAYLQDHHGIAVADDELTPENLDSVERIAAFLERKRNGSRR